MIGQRSQRSPGARRSLGGRHPQAPPPGDSDGEDDLMEYSDSEEVEQEDEEAVGSAIGSGAAPESSGDEVDEEDEEEDGVEDGEDETEEDEDEEDSSDMESHECERRRLDMVAETAELEKQFTVLKEQLFRERVSRLATKLEKVHSGAAPEFREPMEELDQTYHDQMEACELKRELRLSNILCIHDSEMQAADQDMENEKELLWDSLKEDLEEKIRLLEEDRQDVDLMLWEHRRRFDRPGSGRSGGGGGERKRKADPDDPDQRKKPVLVSGPIMVYMLDELEILDDWAFIRKAALALRKGGGK